MVTKNRKLVLNELKGNLNISRQITKKSGPLGVSLGTTAGQHKAITTTTTTKTTNIGVPTSSTAVFTNA